MKPTTEIRILGIDPGLSGGWAVLSRDGRMMGTGGFPTHSIRKNGKASTQLDGRALADLLNTTCATHAFVEAVSSRPRQAGQFQFGVNCGLIHGILHANGVELRMVAPASWKTTYGIKREEDQTKSEKKTQARELAASFYPDHAASFKRVKDDGAAEATLIALYGLYVLQREDGEAA